jgi:hypothetical protein
MRFDSGVIKIRDHFRLYISLLLLTAGIKLQPATVIQSLRSSKRDITEGLSKRLVGEDVLSRLLKLSLKVLKLSDLLNNHGNRIALCLFLSLFVKLHRRIQLTLTSVGSEN